MIAHSPHAERRAQLLNEVADIWTPTPPERPSVWAERERWVSPDASPQPGRWRNDFMPWCASMLDVLYDEPTKAGWVCMKPAQAGVSELYVTLLGWLYCHVAGPVIYLCSRKEDARKFGLERVQYMIDRSPQLRRIFRRGRANNETMYYKEAAGGALHLGGAGSANDFISKPARHVGCDEYDDIGLIPKHGDPWAMLEGRLGAYGTRCRTTRCAWAHPTHPGFGVAKLYRDQTDQRTWCLLCPDCGELFKPLWDHVTIAVEDDPTSATFACPHCGVVLPDAQRWRAAERGRFVSQLPEAEAATRSLAGFHFSKLCTPRVALADLAKQYLACRTEAQLRVFYNKVLGLPFEPASVVITEGAVLERADERHTDRTCPTDTAFIVGGVDVQKPKSNPTLYWAVAAITRRTLMWVLEYGRCRGWGALHEILATWSSPVRETKRALRIRAAAIDCGYVTRQVYDFCRVGHAGVEVVPYKHTPGVTPDEQHRIKTTTDPLRPELGPLKRVETNRTHYMDRVADRFHAEPGQAGGIVLPRGVDRTFINHLLAPTRIEQEDEHGRLGAHWVKEVEAHDDWYQALVGCELMAVALGVDRLYQYDDPRPAAAADLVHQLVEPEELGRQRARKIGAHGKYRRSAHGRRFW